MSSRNTWPALRRRAKDRVGGWRSIWSATRCGCSAWAPSWASFLFQAFALYEGRISVVQSILVTELVFSLVIGRVWLRRHVAPAAWVSASVTSAGLAVFLVMSEPKGGHPQATAQAWLPALLTCGGVAAVLVCWPAAARR